MKRLLLVITLVIASQSLFAQNPSHPLDPLTWQDYWTVLQTLNNTGHLTDSTIIPTMQLLDPPKADVLAWKEGTGPLKRSAFAVLRQGSEAYEAVVNLIDGTLTSYELREGVQAMWVDSDYESMTSILAENEEFMAGLRKRGYDDLNLLSCWAGPPGYFGLDHEIGRRVGHAECYDPRKSRNIWPRGIPGLSAVVDMNTKEILEVIDEEVVPMPAPSSDYDRSAIGPAREVPGPIMISQPTGRGFEMDGYQVSWQKWHFHVRPDLRVGTIISLVTYDDDGDVRSVMYRGS